MFTVFTIEQWNEAEPRVEKILARCGSAIEARRIFDAEVKRNPQLRIVLCNGIMTMAMHVGTKITNVASGKVTSSTSSSRKTKADVS
jgi:hypothetical protein